MISASSSPVPLSDSSTGTGLRGFPLARGGLDSFEALVEQELVAGRRQQKPRSSRLDPDSDHLLFNSRSLWTSRVKSESPVPITNVVT